MSRRVSWTNLRSGTRPGRYASSKNPEPLRRRRFTHQDTLDAHADGYQQGMRAGQKDARLEYVQGMVAGAQIVEEVAQEQLQAAYYRGMLAGEQLAEQTYRAHRVVNSALTGGDGADQDVPRLGGQGSLW